MKKSTYILLAVLLSSTAQAEVRVREPVKGILVTAVAEVNDNTNPNPTAELYTTDRHGLVITTWCINSTDIRLVGDTVGDVIIEGATFPDTGCVNFMPGVVVPPNETLRCTRAAPSNLKCMIAGIIPK